eukprot:m.182797 g.182797  ORF g.182797 m.182797 type:complete len:275 (-) comp14983_c0_seq1:140-964(-)
MHCLDSHSAPVLIAMVMAIGPLQANAQLVPVLQQCGTQRYDGTVRNCTSLKLLSSSGACASPDGPQLLQQINISTMTAPAVSPTTAPSSLQPPLDALVSSENGTLLGAGVLSASQTAYDLDFECVDPGNLRVLPHTACSCKATQLLISVSNCSGECYNMEKCSGFGNTTRVNCENIFVVGWNASDQCAQSAENGCILQPLGNPCPAPYGGPLFWCAFDYSKVTTEVHWAVSCTFTITSDPAKSEMANPTQVQCVGEYAEVGSLGHPQQPGPPTG